MRLLVAVLAFGCLMGAGGASAASPFDGAYRGTATFSSGNGRCAPSRDVSLRVADGKFNYNPGDGGATDTQSVPVGADGAFSVQAGQRYFSGRIQGNALTATSAGGRCTYLWSLTRQ